MNYERGIAHTAEIKLEFGKNYFNDNVQLKKFSYKDSKKGPFYHNVKGIRTTVYYTSWFWMVAYIKVDFYALMNLAPIDEGSCTRICQLIEEYVTYYFGDGLEYYKLLRFDFSVDISASLIERQTLLSILTRKTYDAVDYYKRDSRFRTSVYYNKISKKKNNLARQIIRRKYSKKLLVYDKENKEIGISAYRDIIRFEVAYPSEALRYNKNYYKIERILKSYLNIEAAKKAMIGEYSKILFYGDFYRIDLAIENIQKSELGWDMKRKLIDFVYAVEKFGISKLQEAAKIKNKGKSRSKSYIESLTKDKFKNYMDRLNELDINPITLTLGSSLSTIKNPIKIFEAI